MNLPYLTKESLSNFIETALQEDIGDGDHTSLASLPLNLNRSAQLLIKNSGILAGVELAKQIVQYKSNEVQFEIFIEDGAQIKPGDIAFRITGNSQSILSRERLTINCMQRMSGIATYAHKLQQMIAHTKAKIMDTRKTTPNFRLAEKWAVAIGGGRNHRIGLYDQILLKDNHIDYCGGIKNAITSTQEYLHDKNLNLAVEIETRNLNEVREVLETGNVQIILLDNMPVKQMKEAVRLIAGKFKVEASGNITEKNIKEVAESGVDYISVGALTHSYKSLDMSLKAF